MEKPRERVLPNPISNLKQRPSIRAPTRSPSGEKGPEDSWLRELKASDQSVTKVRPNRFALYVFRNDLFAYLIYEIECMINVYKI